MNMKHLREKIQFPCFQFHKVLQKLKLGDVEKYSIFCLLAFLVTFLPNMRDCAAECIIVFAKSRRLELGDNISRILHTEP